MTPMIVNQWEVVAKDTHNGTLTTTFVLNTALGLLVRTHTEAGDGVLSVALAFIPDAEIRWANEQRYIGDRRKGAGGVAPAGNY